MDKGKWLVILKRLFGLNFWLLVCFFLFSSFWCADSDPLEWPSFCIDGIGIDEERTAAFFATEGVASFGRLVFGALDCRDLALLSTYVLAAHANCWKASPKANPLRRWHTCPLFPYISTASFVDASSFFFLLDGPFKLELGQAVGKRCAKNGEDGGRGCGSGRRHAASASGMHWACRCLN
jgi:hypothetical protein